MTRGAQLEALRQCREMLGMVFNTLGTLGQAIEAQAQEVPPLVAVSSPSDVTLGEPQESTSERLARYRKAAGEA